MRTKLALLTALVLSSCFVDGEDYSPTAPRCPYVIVYVSFDSTRTMVTDSIKHTAWTGCPDR